MTAQCQSSNPGSTAVTKAPAALQVESVRRDFPILTRMVHGHPLVYLDTAASAQRPLAVIEATDRFYRMHNANVHRGVHTLSQEATDQYEAARQALAGFINASSAREVVFTRGTTESINLVAQSFVRPRVGPGDEIVVTHMEHHSNIVPWQMVCEQTGARLRVAPMDSRGELMLDELEAMLSGRVKMLALAHISNALGTINPVKRICEMVHRPCPMLRWMCNHWAVIFTVCPATRCMAPRALAHYGQRNKYWMACRPGRVVAR
jgi:cysteine desulfurase / selenocysteine lyase